jgi:hypothetical protein
MKMRAFLLGSVCLAASVSAHATASHCTEAEETVFSCSLERKIVSVCASKPLTTQSGYVQYRFGGAGKPPFTFPKTDVSPKSVVQARTLMFSGGGGV